MTTLLQTYADARGREAERLRMSVRAELKAALDELLPTALVVVFGSLTRPGGFSEFSDVDIALEAEPAAFSVYQLGSLLAERLGRRVDVVLLSESRLRQRILEEGERWIP